MNKNMAEEEVKKVNPLAHLEKILKVKWIKSPVVICLLIVIIIVIGGTAIVGMFSVPSSDIYRYIPYFLCFQMSIIPIIGAVIAARKYELLMGDISIVDADGTDPNVKSVCRTAYWAVTVLTIMFISTYCLGVLPIFGDESTFIIVNKVIDSTGSLATPLTWFLVLVELLPAVALSYLIIFVSYGVTIWKIRMHRVINKLLNISEGFDHLKEEDMMYNQYYQDTIYARLRDCVENHIVIIQLYERFIQHGKILINFLPFTVIAPVSAGYFILMEVSPKNNFRMIMASITFGAMIAQFCVSGQSAEDMSKDLFRTACETPWYLWQKKNSQVILIFLLNAKDMQLHGYSSVALNYRLMLIICRSAYSLVTLLM